MNYVRFGPELALRQSHEQVSFGFRGKAQLWNYETTEAAPEYDHEYFLASTYLQYKFTRTSLVRLTADYYSRRYSDRPSFDLDGEQRIGNPAIRYDYVAATLRARQRILDDMWFGLEVQRSQRTDRYVGYNDYTRDSSIGRRGGVSTSRRAPCTGCTTSRMLSRSTTRSPGARRRNRWTATSS